MPGQSVIPLADKHEATENPLEGSGIRTKSNTHGLFEWIGNILAFIGGIKILLEEPPSDKVRVRRLISKPIVKILAGAINIIRIPRAPTDSRALIGHIEEQE
ncbi:hypothetical protein X943_003347 [Babesia divergens]|uniref:Uncharacterized protein n=1 Tax=Babesia divergens TaxID=32595 RepID=A0AAD9GII0_BABDI|nr:hypothetical protein X943_003347 [Babesia divergens]